MSGIKNVTSTPARVGLVATMWAFGLVLLALFVWATQWRDTAPVPAAAGTSGSSMSTSPTGGTAPALTALTAGLQQTTGSASTNLRAGHRSDATHALDAAMPLAEVGQEGAAGPLKTAYVTALDAIMSARQSLWNGNPGQAQTDLGRATKALDAAAGATANATDPEPPPPAVWEQYSGAELLASDGQVIGEVQGIENSADPHVRLRIGDATGVFGFIDLGGTEKTVPVEDVLWGRRQLIGSVYAVLTTR